MQKKNCDIPNAFSEAIDFNSNKRFFAKLIIDGDMIAYRYYCNHAPKTEVFCECYWQLY